MKKIIYSLAILALFSQTIVSCDKDDNGTETINPNPNPNPNPGTQSQIQITASAEEVYTGETITFTATLDGQDVTSGTTFYKDDVAIQGNTLTSDVEDTFLIHASYPNAQNSQYVQVSFSQNPFEGIQGTGNLIHNGTSYQVDGGYLYLRQIGYLDEAQTIAVGLWSHVIYNNGTPDASTNYLDVAFTTPYNLQLDELEMPSSTNCTYFGTVYAEVNGQVIVSQFTNVGTATLAHTALNLDVTPATTTFNGNVTNGSNNFVYNYEGSIATFSGKPSNNNQMKAAKTTLVSRSQLMSNLNTKHK